MAKITIELTMVKWEWRQYKEPILSMISKYNFNISVISIFIVFSNNSMSFSVIEIKYSSRKALLASKKYKFLSIISLSLFNIVISLSSFFIFSINFFTFWKIIIIISDIPSICNRALYGEYNSFLFKSFNTNKL